MSNMPFLLQKSCSYPPATNSIRKVTPRPIKPSMKSLLKARQPFPLIAHDDRVNTAREFYTKARALNPYNYALLYDMAILFEGTEEMDEAVKCYQTIISGRDSGNALTAVNAYERMGLAYLDLGQKCKDGPDREKFTKRAEDMFMSSLVLCRQAVAHLPKVSANRANLWDTSYTKLLAILSQRESGAGKLKKEAEVHELVGQYLEAVEVYQKVIEVASNRSDQAGALMGCLRSYMKVEKVNDAKFMLDLFLASDQRDVILMSASDDMKELRVLSADVYFGAARLSLESKDIVGARECFRTALLLMKMVKEEAEYSLRSDVTEKFDLCIFTEFPEDVCGLEDGGNAIDSVSSALSKTFHKLFGMRVSVNDMDVMPGHLSLSGEFQLAVSAPLVLLVVYLGAELSNRMEFICNVAIDSHKYEQIFVATIGNSGQKPSLVNSFRSIDGTEIECLSEGCKFTEHVAVCCSLFNFMRGR